MKNNTTVKTAQLNVFMKRVCLWDDSALLKAAFMFPTKHFKDVDEMNNLGDNEFYSMIEEMLKICQPIDNENAKLLCKGVLSGNRLRIYYQALSFVEQAIELSNGLGNNLQDLESLNNRDLNQAFEERGFIIENTADQDQRKIDEELENMLVY